MNDIKSELEVQDDSIHELNVLKGERNVFDFDTKYVIPLYQRAFAWGDAQLEQLIEDIEDVADDANYYIGSLIVSDQKGKYEVIDGQQRLTSLYLLLKCLGYKLNEIDAQDNAGLPLTFACREKSNYTLEHLDELLAQNISGLDMDRIETNISKGLKCLTDRIRNSKLCKRELIDRLSRVIVYRIEVPECTDLNRYFETMNVRGEQLEQHDILKAKLMGFLSDESERVMFSKIWDACSDMTGYVQMHFTSRQNEIREKIFGKKWRDIPSGDLRSYVQPIEESTSGNHGCNKSYGWGIDALIEKSFKIDNCDGVTKDDIRVRFESVIGFTHFLLHTLKVYVYLNNVRHKDDRDSKIIAELLDDKNLLKAFKKVLDFGLMRGGEINKEEFARSFIICLLRTRYLFDKFIIKREYENDVSDGQWSLKSLDVSGNRTERKAYFSNTKFSTSKNDELCKRNIMIQSALRVSYTSPKVMHWITKLLIWLSENNCQHIEDQEILKFHKKAESLAIDAVSKDFLLECYNGVYEMGVKTPHIVFNFLDYLLWLDESDKYGDFEFEFRNSVEHWYPRNPSEGTFEKWKDGVDRFGNLCLIQRNVNSKFSNMSPEAKKSTFDKMISKGSLKLRVMSERTEKHDNKVASLYWKETGCKKHEEEMIKRLEKACDITALYGL